MPLRTGSPIPGFAPLGRPCSLQCSAASEGVSEINSVLYASTTKREDSGVASQEQLYGSLDPRFFMDYVEFSGALRHYVAKTLENAFNQDPNDIHRRFYILGIYKEEYAAYEDMGAILQAFIKWKRKEIKNPIEAILRYTDDKVILANLFSRTDISSAQQLYSSLSLSDWIPRDWSDIYPTIDLEKVLKVFCQFIYEDCQRNQKKYGIDAYNKLKHGLVVAPNSSYYISGLPNTPAVFIKNRKPNNTNQYELLCVPMDDASLQERNKSIEFVQSTIRTLVSLYVIHRYSNLVVKRWTLKNPIYIFETPALRSLKEFIQQISIKSVTKF